MRASAPKKPVPVEPPTRRFNACDRTRIAANDAQAVRLTKKAINRSLDIGGMRQAMLAALDIDAEIETSETAESREFNEILRRDGAKAAIAWRSARAAQPTGKSA